MRRKQFRRPMSLLLSAALTVSCMTVGFTASAANTWGPEGNEARGKAQPTFSGYRMKDVKNWDRETDPYADFLQAKVPLQQRIDAFAPTQANPELSPNAKVMLMQGEYDNAFFDSMMYNNDYSQHCLNFWQYTDYFSPWHGAATAYTPSSFYDPAVDGTKFEFGMLNIPNPAYTNAAHKNGVKSIACLYFDRRYRMGQSIDELVEQDDEGNYVLVEKLAEIAEYYGFDGYFINREETPAGGNQGIQRLADMMEKLREKGLYVQYYDSDSEMGNKQKNWVKNGQLDSVFYNYGGMGNAKDAAEWSGQNGIDVYDTAFYGLECNIGKFKSEEVLDGYMPNSKNLYASVALFTPSDYYQRGLDFGPKEERPTFQQDEYQWMVAQRERMFFSGVAQDPTNTGKLSGYGNPDIGVDPTYNAQGEMTNDGAEGWVGVADFITERSVAGGSTFYSNFNTGHGMQYYHNGEVSRDEQWTNINLQSILPSWQWWIETEGEKLNVDFDYGLQEARKNREGGDIGAPFTQVGGYQGGSSLVVYGDIEKENVLRLFKTDLTVKENSKLSITYNKPSVSDNSKMEIGVVFKNAPDTMVTFNIPNAGKQTDGWVTKQISLPEDYAGEEIAALGLVFSDGKTGVKDYQMNVGELKVTDGENHTPEAPSGLSVKEAYDTKEMVLSWDLDDYDQVEQYHVYANLSDGSRISMGGVYDSIYYVKNTTAQDIVTMEVTAVGKDGSESQPAVIDYSYRQNVSNIRVNEALDGNGLTMQAADAGYLDVSWENPNVEYTGLRLTLSLKDSKDSAVYTMDVDNGEDSARFYVPRGHGETYLLSIATILPDGSQSQPVAYRGVMRDVYSDPINPSDVILEGANIRFVNPDSVDWYKIHCYVDGKEEVTLTRSRDDVYKANALPGGSGTVDIVLEDYSGNLSRPVSLDYNDPYANLPITASNVPDPVLMQAIHAQAGKTVKQVKEFTGTLDLSNMDIHNLTGLNLLKNAGEIKLCGTDVGVISADTFGINVGKVDLSGCTSLKAIDGAAFEGSSATREVDITGCTALQVLEIRNSSVGLLTYGTVEDHAALKRLDLSGSRFDLSPGTPERELADYVAARVTPGESVEETDPNETNMAVGATIVKDQTTLPEAEKLFDGLYGNTDIINVDSFPVTVVADLGAQRYITSWTLRNDGTGLCDFELFASEDGETYTSIAQVEGNRTTTLTQRLETPVTARYFKLVATRGISGWVNMVREFELIGNAKLTYQSGVEYDNQRPLLQAGEVDSEVVVTRKPGAAIDLKQVLLDALQKADNQALTVRGNTAQSLQDVDFIDPAYSFDSLSSDADRVHVNRITDSQGNSCYGETVNLSESGVYTVDYITCDSANTEGETLYTFKVSVRSVTSVLEAAIANAEQLQKDGALEGTMEAVVNEFNAALKAAKELLNKEDATQEEVNSATIRLLSAMAKVDWKQGDKTSLEIAIEVAETIEPNLNQYVDECVQPFQDALAAAREIMASGNAWDNDIKLVTANLIDAMSNMRMKADKQALSDMIEKAKAADLSAYTAESAEAVRKALESAEAIMEDGNASQDTVDAIVNTLKEALAGLIADHVGNGSAGNANTVTTAPVGEGSTPSKTGDGFHAAGLGILTLISAAGALWMIRNKKK